MCPSVRVGREIHLLYLDTKYMMGEIYLSSNYMVEVYLINNYVAEMYLNTKSIHKCILYTMRY